MSDRREFDVHIVDGTYELFRHFFGAPEHLNRAGLNVGAARAVVRSMITMLEDGVTHLGVATDHVVESFRNQLYDGYKTGEGMDPEIAAQFGPLEVALEAVGIATYPMVEHEADDGMAALAKIAEPDERVGKIFLCTPDKDLAQCVQAGRILQLDRRHKKLYDVAEVIEKFGVPPESIPDWLGLVGDAADGFPGLKGWGAKSAAAVLTRYKHIENIPLAGGQWDITVRGGAKLAKTLADNLEDALLFRKLAVLADEAPTAVSVDELKYEGPADWSTIEKAVELLDAPDLPKRIKKLLPATPTSSETF